MGKCGECGGKGEWNGASFGCFCLMLSRKKIGSEIEERRIFLCGF